MAHAKKKELVPVSTRAAIQRINRALAQKYGTMGAQRIACVQMKKAKGSKAIRDLGEYYLLNVADHAVEQPFVDLEGTARKLGVLAPWETIVDEPKGGER